MRRTFQLTAALYLTAVSLLPASFTAAQENRTANATQTALEEVTIVGDKNAAAASTGSAQVVDSELLARFEYADIQKILREVPGVSVQLEDGYGLRPNLSIRGTATERSGRITLLEDNVLIAPAPYSAPSAYYFPTTGRMERMEVLKGSAAIKQGPYTVGGALNMVSTQIPDVRGGWLNTETGSNSTHRVHAHYGDSSEQFGWLVESHLWRSDGFQNIDFSNNDTGLDKDDWMVKLRFNSKPGAAVYHQLDVKLQLADEDSQQSYLGLTDEDFAADSMRRYLASQWDEISTEHEQVIVRYLVSPNDNVELTATAYNNTHARNWFKTEGLDFDGSATAEEFSRTSWSSVIQGVNLGEDVAGASLAEIQALLDGGDSAVGAIQVRSNAREYFSRGLQLGAKWQFETALASHALEAGIRYHEDEEDRLQRNSTYTQLNGTLELADLGLLGNAGNRLQEAQALSMHIYDRIEIGDWTLTPGLRYEDIDQQRTRWETRSDRTDDPASRNEDNLRSTRDNQTRVWLPGVGVRYAFNNQFALYGGVHRGFTAPSNAPDVDEEKSVNYELGMRFIDENFSVDAAAFFTDYDNLLGECTASSGTGCEIGSAFNGDAASILGLEMQLDYSWALNNQVQIPVSLSYTYLDAEFDSNIADTSFFGDVSIGDPLPHIPRNQALLSVGLERGPLSSYVRANYIDDVCVRASCGEFERVDSLFTLDLSTHYQLSERLTVYGKWENASDTNAIVARRPYGARPLRDPSVTLGFRFAL